MSTFDVLSAIQDSALAHAISKSDHLVGAGLQILHVLGLILFLASLVLISLRLLGWVFAEQSIEQVAAGTSRLLWSGLALTALSGTLMFVASPKLYFYNWAFGLKMALVLIAIVVQATVFRRLMKRDSPNPRFARVGVSLAVGCWFAVALTGRMIGFV